MNVKTIKDFEKELRRKIRDEFETERKTNTNLARVLLVSEANLWDGIKNGSKKKKNYLFWEDDKSEELEKILMSIKNLITKKQ